MLSIMRAIEFEAELWEHEGQGAWCFVTVPADPSEDIRLSGAMPAGFGSYKVEVVGRRDDVADLGLPGQQVEGFVLPVKKAVRTAEHIEVGDVGPVSLDGRWRVGILSGMISSFFDQLATPSWTASPRPRTTRWPC